MQRFDRSSPGGPVCCAHAVGHGCWFRAAGQARNFWNETFQMQLEPPSAGRGRPIEAASRRAVRQGPEGDTLEMRECTPLPQKQSIRRTLFASIEMIRAAITVTAFASLLATCAPAQWLNYPARGIPRTPDGKPNLAAPTPRTSDGKPDLSGIWSGPGAGSYDRNIARDLKPADIQPWAEALYQQRVLNEGKDSSARELFARPLCLLPCGRCGPDRANSGTDRDAVSGHHQQRSPDDLHRRPQASGRSESHLDGVLGRALGGRHAGGRYGGFQ